MDSLRLLKRRNKEEHRKREAERRRKRLEAASPSSDVELRENSALPAPVEKSSGVDSDETLKHKSQMFSPDRKTWPVPASANCQPRDAYFPQANASFPRNVGFRALKTSPSSSVSMSQSPPKASKKMKRSYLDDSSSEEEDLLAQSRLLDLKRANRSKQVALESEKKQFDLSVASVDCLSDKKPAAKPVSILPTKFSTTARKSKSYLDDSDSSEDDIVEKSRCLVRNRENGVVNNQSSHSVLRNEAKNATTTSGQNTQTLMRAQKAVEAKKLWFDSEVDDVAMGSRESGTERACKGARKKSKSISRCSPRANKSTSYLDDSDSSDDDIVEQSRRLTWNRESGMVDNKSSQPATLYEARLSTTKLARNPLTLMRAQDDAEANTAVREVNSQAIQRLWSDSEGDDLATKSPDSGTQEIRGLKKKRKRQPGLSTAQVDRHVDRASTPNNPKKVSPTRYAELMAEQKPHFDRPIYGPFQDAVPLRLGNEEGQNSNEMFSVPFNITRYLKGYQLEGVQFLYEKAIALKQGAILGDDMGMGKTIQTIALLAALLMKKGTGEDLIELSRRRDLIQANISRFEEEQSKALKTGTILLNTLDTSGAASELRMPKWSPILIACPNSVMRNWTEDFSTWGYFSVATYHGDGRQAALESVETGMVEVLVCAHSMMQSLPDFVQLNAAKMKWKVVIIDEFHKFKNEKGNLATNLRAMRENHKPVIIGLTGTIMQNNHKELWNLADLAVPDLYGPWTDFEQKYARHIKLSRTRDANDEAVAMGDAAGRDISSKLAEIYLRRTKDEMLSDQLPNKDERIIFCEPSILQKKLYQHILEQPDFVLLRHCNAPCDCGVNEKFFLEFKHLRSKDDQIEYQRRNRKNIFKRKDCCYQVPKLPDGAGLDPCAILWRQQHPNLVACRKCPSCIFFSAISILYKVSAHAGLLQVDSKETPDQFGSTSKQRERAEYAMERAKHFIPEELLHLLPGGYVRKSSITDDHFALSGKMLVLDKLLRSISSQQGRVLLFACSTKALDLIGQYLDANGYTFLRMDGSTALAQRTEIADNFTNDSTNFVFLLSTKACGTGLNLTAANFVIMFDVDWNPANDTQAQDRAFRIGQTEDVKVFRLVCRGTVEEMKYLRQVYKQHLHSETIVDIEDSDRAKSKRMFRGVEGDDTRKGELFGSENLLKFNADGSFMDYGHSMKKAESSKFGVGIHDTENLVRKVMEMNEDELDEIGDNGHMFKDLAKCTDASESSCDDENHPLGGESQAVMDICERADVDDDNSICEEIDTANIPTRNGNASLQTSECAETAAPTVVEKFAPDKAMTTKTSSSFEDIAAIDTQSAPPESTSTQSLHVMSSRSNSNDRKDKLRATKDRLSDADMGTQQNQQKEVEKINTSISSPGESARLTKKSSPRNTKLVGKTTGRIRSNEAGQTTFTAFDLPGGPRKKKESKKIN